MFLTRLHRGRLLPNLFEVFLSIARRLLLLVESHFRLLKSLAGAEQGFEGHTLEFLFLQLLLTLFLKLEFAGLDRLGSLIKSLKGRNIFSPM